MKTLIYKKAVNRVEGTTESGAYIEITPGKKLVIELYRDGQEAQEIPLADVIQLGLSAYEAQARKAVKAENFVGGVRQ